MKLETLALARRLRQRADHDAATTLIYQTVVHLRQRKHGADLFDLKVAGNIYTRIMNPTQAVLEQRLAEMEGGVASLCMVSGMAAITASTVHRRCRLQHHQQFSQLYGGGLQPVCTPFHRQGIEVRFTSHR